MGKAETDSGFGQAVRRWRDRVAPEAAGLSDGGHRRAPGLRREELAMLAGISVDYVTRLEQGRAANPSTQVVEALARALRLAGPEREHLFRLAGLAPPGPGTVPTYITPSVQRMLDRLAGTPVAVYDASLTLLTANPPYAALMGDPSGWRGSRRNSVWRHFLGPGTRARHTPESLRLFETALVADLRSAVGRYPADQPPPTSPSPTRRTGPTPYESAEAVDVVLHRHVVLHRRLVLHGRGPKSARLPHCRRTVRHHGCRAAW